MYTLSVLIIVLLVVAVVHINSSIYICLPGLLAALSGHSDAVLTGHDHLYMCIIYIIYVMYL